MTSQKSSPANNRRAFSPFLYTFSRAFSENFIFPLLNLLWIIFIVPVQTLTGVFLPALSDTSPDAPALTEQFKYVVLSDTGGTLSAFLILGVCLFSGLTGVFLFRFMAAKKTVNVYYSLGIKRHSLFLAKYAAGAVMLAVSIAIPMLVSAFVNIHYLGSSAEMWRAVLYYMLSLYILAMLCMTVTAAVFSAVGTVLEGLGFSAVILLLPTILIYCVNVLMTVVLWGNPYTAGGFYAGEGERYIYVQSLASLTKPYNPVFFADGTMNNIAAMSADGKTNPLIYMEQTAFVAPNFWALLPWIAVIAVCLGIALLVFQRRRAEICGFLGRCRALNFIIELTLGFGVFTAAISFLYDRLNHALVVLIAAILYLLVYVIVEAILTRSGKLLLKGLWKLPIHLAIALIAYGIFAGGLFGYVSRIPETDQIKEVYIDADYDPSVYNIDPSISPYMDNFAAINTMNSGTLGAFTTQDDKEKIVRLHQLLIDGRKDQNKSERTSRSISIRYVLIDGSNLMRNYNITTNDVLYETLCLYETDWSREKMRQTISADPAMPELPEDAGGDVTTVSGDEVIMEYNYYGEIPENSEYGYETGSVYLSNGVAEMELKLTREQHAALKQALIADVTTQTAQQKFRPERPADYTLLFESKLKSGGFSLDLGIPMVDYGRRSYPLTDGMDNTRRFLEESGLLAAAAQNDAAPDAVRIRRMADCLSTQLWSGDPYSMASRMFISVTNDATPEYNNPTYSIPEVTLTADQFESLRPHLYNYYYTRGTGYVVSATYEEADIIVSYYLPAEFAPDAIQAQLGA